MTDEGADQPMGTLPTAAESSAAPRVPGPLRLVAGLTIVGALLPFSGLPPKLVYVFGTAALTALHTWGLVRYRPRPRWLWWLVATCLWVLVVGDVVAVTVDEPVGEAFLAIGYTLGIFAAGALVRLRGERDPGTLIDALLVTAVVGAVLWHVSVAPAVGPDAAFGELVRRIVISVMHLVGLFLVARLLTGGRVSVGLWLFTAGFSLTVLIDIATTTTGQTFLAPTWIAIIIVSRGAFAALTLAPETRELVPRHRADHGPTIRHRMAALTGILGVVLVPVLAVIGLQGRVDLVAYVVLVPLAVVALAVRVWGVLGEHERAREQLVHDAEHDPLTGLANRRSLTRHMEETLETAESPGLAVLYCDLDGFKLVNDRLGHTAGDECLQIISRRLAGILRPGDLLGRIGGDEFVMSCRDVGTPDEAEAIARRVVEAVNQPLVVEDTEVTLHVSVGVRFAKPGVTAERLITDADQAMYTAKRSSIARRGSDADAVHHMRSATIAVHDPLDDAISRDELRLHLQPICRLDTGRLTSVEALVRWQHPSRGLLPPDEFVPMAERTGLIDSLGRWTLIEACRWLAAERARGLGADVAAAVNVSPRQLVGDRLLTDVIEAVEVTGVPPHLLCLEITESVLLADREAARGLFGRLRDLGVRLAIDDFGAGYSSLAALSWLPVDTIKLDRSFTASLHAFGRERAVARAAVMLGRELGLSVVAEGVETRRQWNLLRELGCHEAQGFLLGRPGPTLRVESPGWIPEEAPGRIARQHGG